MSGNSERPKVAAQRGKAAIKERVIADAYLLVEWLVRKDLVETIRSLDDLLSVTSLIGIRGTNRYLRFVVRTARIIINSRYEVEKIRGLKINAVRWDDVNVGE